jgi:hypothetical protein
MEDGKEKEAVAADTGNAARQDEATSDDTLSDLDETQSALPTDGGNSGASDSASTPPPMGFLPRTTSALMVVIQAIQCKSEDEGRRRK